MSFKPSSAFWWKVNFDWATDEGLQKQAIRVQFKRLTVRELDDLNSQLPKQEPLKNVRDFMVDWGQDVLANTETDVLTQDNIADFIDEMLEDAADKLEAQALVTKEKAVEQLDALADLLRGVVLDVEDIEIDDADGNPLPKPDVIEWCITNTITQGAMYRDYTAAIQGRKLDRKN